MSSRARPISLSVISSRFIRVVLNVRTSFISKAKWCDELSFFKLRFYEGAFEGEEEPSWGAGGRSLGLDVVVKPTKTESYRGCGSVTHGRSPPPRAAAHAADASSSVTISCHAWPSALRSGEDRATRSGVGARGRPSHGLDICRWGGPRGGAPSLCVRHLRDKVEMMR